MTLFTFRKGLIALSLFLTLGVILLGAYTRLVDAGLGCPDWPGCYGLWKAPLTEHDKLVAQAAFPLIPIDYMKAHTEMVHRYFASSLGLLILLITGITWGYSHPLISRSQKILTLGLTALVLFQGLLGMWTVTLKLLPVVVMAHLLGGLCLLSLLFCLWMVQNPLSALWRLTVCPGTHRLAQIALIAVGIQIALGGWTSTNYAALSCPDFPLCQNRWWPTMSWQAFDIFGALHVNNPLSYMTLEARTTIHMAHRLGALITTVLILMLLKGLARAQHSAFFMILLGTLLCLQIGLGITNVVDLLPLNVALAHNGVATLLLLSMIYLQFYLKSGPAFFK